MQARGYGFGLEISFPTAFWLFWQKEQRSELSSECLLMFESLAKDYQLN
jgi:hypothetical protein